VRDDPAEGSSGILIRMAEPDFQEHTVQLFVWARSSNTKEDKTMKKTILLGSILLLSAVWALAGC
jgi:hypothetical protein